MPARHVALIAFAALVLGGAVYLFIEVRATPATASTKPAKAQVNPTGAPVASAQTGSQDVEAPKLDGDKVVVNDGQAGTPLVGSEMRPIHGGKGKLAPAADDKQVAKRDPDAPNPKLDQLMDEANKAYDRNDVDEARAIAGKILSKKPDNARMLRIMVSTSCIDGDKATAQKYFGSLPPFDREQMKKRCQRDYNITLEDPPAQ